MTVDQLIRELYDLVADGYNARDEVTYKGQPINSISEMYIDDGTCKWELSDEKFDEEEEETPMCKRIDWEQRIFHIYYKLTIRNWDFPSAYEYAKTIVENYKQYVEHDTQSSADA